MKQFLLVLKSNKKTILQHINHQCASCKLVKGAMWKRSLVDKEKGVIFCEWEAREASEIFKGLEKVGIEEEYEIYEVEDIEPHKCCNSIFGEVD